MHPERVALTWRSVAAIAAALALVLFLHGAVPFAAMPTLGLAAWTTGFAQSFANQSIFAIHATNIGAPYPAAIAFGLSGAYPTGLLIRLGLHPGDAYTAMVAGWLCVAFFGAWRLARSWGASPLPATAGALLWLSLPIVLGHHGYAMLALGMALLPFYFYGTSRLLEASCHAAVSPRIRACLLFVACSVIAVFMDGYTFVMFAVGSGVLWAWRVAVQTDERRQLLLFALPILLLGTGFAYALYVAYVGRSSFSTVPIDFFRAWGVDLSFLAIPTRDRNWLFDALGWSTSRSHQTYFGDASVWLTTFCLPLIIAALFAFWRTRRSGTPSAGWLAVALLGFYLALGPSLKIDSQKPETVPPAAQSMPAEYAVMPTGSAWLSENIPGLTSMRATYRWTGLGVLGLWALLMRWASRPEKSRSPGPTLLLLAVVIATLPPIQREWLEKQRMRPMFQEMDSALVADLRHALTKNERVAFLPYTNDFLVSYLAARADVRAYNIGGDKNLEVAQQHWPSGMLKFSLGQIDDDMSDNIARLLLNDQADAVVLPYFDSMWAASVFPCIPPEVRATTAAGAPTFDCPDERRQRLSPVRRAFAGMPEFAIQEHGLFATVRIAPDVPTAQAQKTFEARYFSPVRYPLAVSSQTPALRRILLEGWYEPEPTHLWSTASAELELPVPPQCESGGCATTLRFFTFGATHATPVTVHIHVIGEGSEPAVSMVATADTEREVSLPVPSDASTQRIRLEIPDAQSPADVSESADTRTLGVGLRSVNMAPREQE